MIDALALRCEVGVEAGPETFRAWDRAYADAMRDVHAAFPDDLDVVALFAEALIMRTPWKLWDVRTGAPMVGADTEEAVAVLEAGTRLAPVPHPGILHMTIHTLEMSPQPERALAAADALRDLMPDVGHLHHMPGHIYVQCGMYEEAVAVSEKAVAAHDKYLAHAGPYNFYTTARCHDLHLLMYAAMFAGRFQPAWQAARAIRDTLTPDVLQAGGPHMLITLEGYYSMAMHVLVRFGQWRQIVEAPLPADPELYCVSTAMHRYARGVAYAALGEIEAAQREQAHFEAACARIPDERRFFNNHAHDILAIGAEMLAGELAYRQGAHDDAFAHLRRAVHLDDNLFYTEPWAWMHPPRHALGALLLEQGRVTEALAVYEADLGLDDSLSRCCRHPDNVWALHGYVECLTRLGQDAEAAELQPRLDRAVAMADVAIAASCCCRSIPSAARPE